MNAPNSHDFDSKESPIRYLAYASRLSRFSRYLAFTSDVGEAFRPVISPFAVKLTYGISFAYCIGDIGFEGWKSIQRNDEKSLTSRIVLERTIFQGLASIFLPAVTIHTIVSQAQKQLKSRHFSPRVVQWGPSAIGLACLPLLPVVLDEPIEMGMEKLFDNIWPLTPSESAKIKHHSVKPNSKTE